MRLRLGRRPSAHDARTARFSDFVNVHALPASPPVRDWTDKLPADLGMMRNDELGDCAYAAPAHMVQVFTSQRGRVVTISDADVVAAYSAGTGYDPADPSTDRGANMLAVCKQWRSAGIGGHKIGAFVRVAASNAEHVRAAVNLFGAVFVGANLPVRAQGQVGSLWQVPGPLQAQDQAGGWGGHAMAVATYDHIGPTFITWGARQRATWAWWANYVDEVYAAVADDWVSGAVPAPSGVDATGLKQYLSKL